MNDERLKALLHEADRIDDGELPHDLPSATRRIARRKLKRRRVTGGAFLALAALALWSVWAPWDAPPKEPQQVLQATVFQTPQPDLNTAVDVLDPIAQAREETAATMLFFAQRRAPRVAVAETRRQYERTIALFPESRGAALARVALTKLTKEQP